jgi:sterol 3beta-glucosyltransferase
MTVPTVTKGSALSGLFDASLYDKFLVECGSKPRCPFFSSRSKGSAVVEGFADLVAGDLDSPEKAIAGRFAKLSVAGESLSDESISPEVESIDTGSDSSDSSHPEAVKKKEDPVTPDASDSQTADSDTWELAPDEVVNLIVQEFGPLAADGEEEKLIIESDGALLQDVVILGVIHLTTHRLTFHASLLSSRPDLSPNQQVIKAGPALMHRCGWRKKSKLWLELSHDMISTYASSRDEDHIKPLRTVLYSNVKEIVPIDRKHPKLLRVKFQIDTDVKGYVEFDTEESAQDWRKELQGALFLYRHRRRQFMENDGPEDLEGVRIYQSPRPSSRLVGWLFCLVPSFCELLEQVIYPT